MKYLKTYQSFFETIFQSGYSDLTESLSVWQDSLLASIQAEELDMYNTFKLTNNIKPDLDVLNNSNEFINSLSSIGLKKNSIVNTDDSECLIKKSCRFLPIYKIESNDLEDPNFLIIQFWNETLNKWDDAKLYKINDDMKKFYDKLTNRTIEISSGGKNYTYKTSNSGNEWNLEKGDDNEQFKKYLRKEDMEELLKHKNIKLNIL